MQAGEGNLPNRRKVHICPDGDQRLAELGLLDALCAAELFSLHFPLHLFKTSSPFNRASTSLCGKASYAPELSIPAEALHALL